MVIVTHELYDSVLVGTGKQKSLESLCENRELRRRCDVERQVVPDGGTRNRKRPSADCRETNRRNVQTMWSRRPQPSPGCHVGNTGEHDCRCDGEVPWMDRYVITASLKEIRSGTRGQWRLMSAGVMCALQLLNLLTYLNRDTAGTHLCIRCFMRVGEQDVERVGTFPVADRDDRAAAFEAPRLSKSATVPPSSTSISDTSLSLRRTTGLAGERRSRPLPSFGT